MYVELDKINKSFGSGDARNHVLKDVSFRLEKGEICVLLGASGSGKSTLLNIIGAIDHVDSGSLRIASDQLNAMEEKELSLFRRKHIGYIFQAYNLIPNLTVRENIEVGSYLSNNPLDIDKILDILGLTKHQDKLPSQISGGQQQRTSIGRAIIKNPDLLLCDEPTGALDFHTSLEILKLLEDINREFETTIILVTHNATIRYMADRVITLHDGQIRENYMNHQKSPASSLEW